jgi:putative chitinase
VTQRSIRIDGEARVCIENSVGRLGVNQKVDIKIVQVLLNLAINELLPRRALNENGRFDSQLLERIECVQQRARIVVTGLVETNSPTLAYLKQLLPAGLTQAKLQGVMAGAPAQTISKYYTSLSDAMRRYDINTPKRMKHFLAQIGHESGQLMWCSEFASGDAYEGRKGLGNTQTGDGRRFKGRGLIQITGRANYTAFSKAAGTDFTTDAGATLLSTDAYTAVEASCWFWKRHNLNNHADLDDFMAITRIINGGTNGLADRRRILERASFFLE